MQRRQQAAWNIWKLRIGEDIKFLIKKFQKGSIPNQIEAAERFGFINHPLVKKALTESSTFSDPKLETAVRKAMQRLGL